MHLDDARAWAGKLSAHPRRVEVVVLNFEHRAVGSAIWSAEIERTEGGQPFLGEWNCHSDGQTEGRFIGMLAKGQG
jgi:hypothetical protein